MVRTSVQTGNFDIGAEFAALTAGTNGYRRHWLLRRHRARQPATVAAMTLEHYPAMTERAIARIAEEAESALVAARLHGDPSGRPAAGRGEYRPGAGRCSHRQPALDATAFLIDWLKTKAPFWKKEESAGGARVLGRSRRGWRSASLASRQP